MAPSARRWSRCGSPAEELAVHTLLLVDPSPAVRRVVEAAFADTGVEVVSAADGDEAMWRVAEARPDIVLADVGMPVSSGYDVCTRVKAAYRPREVPVLLLAGALQPVDDDRARAAGCDGVLSKPLEAGLLIARVRDLLGRDFDDCFDQLDAPVAGLGGRPALPAEGMADDGAVPTLEGVLANPSRGEADGSAGDWGPGGRGVPTLAQLLGGEGDTRRAPDSPAAVPVLTDEFVEAVAQRVTGRLAAEHGAAIEQAVARAVRDAVEPAVRAAVDAGVARLLEQATAEVAGAAEAEVSRVAVDVVVEVSERLVREEIARIREQV
jgi:CheY-like chemotaxis protein